ncbi:MAG: hypothetical protein DHS20C15_30220 [Planctomycetota bacterium]|nr:MAG: hypothetical protein DHS20C15_30220 [Planctomycetota bacterium]
MMHLGSARLACALLAGLLAPSALAQSDPLTQLDTISLAPLNRAELAKEDTSRELAGQPYRFALPVDVYADPDTIGTWQAQPDGTMVWTLRVQAPGAASLNFAFAEYELPDGASLVLRATDGSARIRPFTSADNSPHGELWTPVLPSDDVLIELTVPGTRFDDVKLTLMRIGHGYRGFAPTTPASASYSSGSCNIDVVCPEGDDWPLEIAASGAYTLNGFEQCSGSLINDTADSLTPFFLTADHCGISPSNQAAVVVYWNFENSVCRPAFSPASGGAGDGSLSQFSSGVIFRADYNPSDMTLVEIEDPIDPAWDVAYAGWDRSDSATAEAIAIHHPQVEEKRISFEFQPTSITSYLSEPIPGDGTHVRVTDWDVGTTEPGSSGSPLFSPEHRIIGQLHGGFASCTSQTSDWYGRVAVSWNGGGTPSTRLSDWLDPLGTGAMTTDSISLNTLCAEAGTVAFLGSGSYACTASVPLRVVDCGLNLDDGMVETISILVTSVSEPGGELVMLTETSPGSARFEGALSLNTIDAPGVLLVSPGEALTATYDDADTGSGSPATVQSFGSTDCTPAMVASVSTSGVTAFSIDVDVSASEAVSTTVHYGTSCGALNDSASATGNPATSQQVGLDGLQNGTTYFFSVEVVDTAGNSTLDDNGGACYSFATDDAADYFTEQFLSDFDLDGMSATFTPGGSENYLACVEPIVSLPSSLSGTAFVFDDDDNEQIAFGGGKAFEFFGQNYTSVFVSSNGYLTFGAGDSDYDETLEEHFELPRVAPLYDDLNPSDIGTVRWQSLADRLVVSWDGVTEYSSDNSNTFQVELFYAPVNEVRMSWLGIDSTDSIVGLSEGTNLQPDFLEQNLSGFDDCNNPVICQLDLGSGGPGNLALSVCGDALDASGSATYHVENARAFSTVFHVLGLSNAPVPFKGGMLLPFPYASVLSSQANASGVVNIVVPGSVVGGALTVFAQSLASDPSQIGGYELSNAVQIEFLP